MVILLFHVFNRPMKTVFFIYSAQTMMYTLAMCLMDNDNIIYCRKHIIYFARGRRV